MLVYVDDGVLTRNNEDWQVYLKVKIEFALKNLNKLQYFLGLEIKHISRVIFIS